MGSGISRREFIQAGALGAAGVLLGGRALQAQTVAPAATGGDSYTFAVISDPHLRENREGEPTGAEKFRAMLARIEQQTPRPEFILMPGDIHPEKLEPLLPETRRDPSRTYKRKPGGGRKPRYSDRLYFQAIVYVLRNGLIWNELPRE